MAVAAVGGFAVVVAVVVVVVVVVVRVVELQSSVSGASLDWLPIRAVFAWFSASS